jgi:hypothetical protein
MSELLTKLQNLGKECPGLLHELKRISGFPEQFQPYYLSDLLRTYQNEIGLRNPNVQEEWRRATDILVEAGIRPATKVDDVVHQVLSEKYLKNKWDLA